MTIPALDPQQVANFLQNNAQFFETYADVFAKMQIPHPHGKNAISLSERQILLLRTQTRTLEWQLSELMQHAQANENIIGRITRWCCLLIAEPHAHRLPEVITDGLSQTFELSEAALRLWGLPDLPENAYSQPVSEAIRSFTSNLKTPYCGTNTGFEAVTWLNGKPQSLALVALRLTTTSPPVGLLVLASDDATRFSSEMATTFLDTVGQLASTALQRLAKTA
jgi:uncharacterized protein YigA (DUF484 family)